MSSPETYRYNVSTNMADAPYKIDAAYYQHEPEFTIFKSSDGKILASFANRHIVGIEREVVAVRGGSGMSLRGTLSIPDIGTAVTMNQHGA